MNETTPMRFYPRALRELTVTYSKADVAVVAALAALITVWAAIAGGDFSFRALLACEVMFFSFYITGSLFAAWRSLAAGLLFDLPLRLLVGYVVVNTALLALAWLSPLGVIANFCAIATIVGVVWVAAGEHRQSQEGPARLWAVGIAAAATTLWCQDSIDPIDDQGNWQLFKPWIDGFYHAVHIRIFADSHGASSIEDFRMAGISARVYHYGVYMMPAFIKQASAIHSYAAFAGILAPVGVLFTGLAAYAFFASLWGCWPGLAACAALLLLPDGNQQAGQNPYLSYHWLTQISPSATYGLALLAVAWLFVIQGCARGSRLQLYIGWVLSAVLVLYKLHYAIASSLLLLLVPVFAFRGSMTHRKRGLWAVAACALYVAALMIGQKVPGVPVIRLDGSSVGEIQRLIQSFQAPGPIRDYLAQHTGADASAGSNLLFGIPYVLTAALGVFVPLLAVLAFRLRVYIPLLHRVFPFVLLGNFLVMFCGLELDFTSSTPDELSHRPVMIVYFFVVSWIGGAVGLAIVNSPRLSRMAPKLIPSVAILLMTVPALFGAGVQLMPALSQISPVRVPTALVRVAEYMRTHGAPDDIFQDSQFDRVYAIAALSERRPFVAHTLTRMSVGSDEVARRTAAVNRLLLMNQPRFLVGTARAFGVRWFVVHKGDGVNWPSEFTEKPALEAGPLRLYAL
jgi:hypothetical protein